MESGHPNRLTIHILAVMAEDEARRISERTKAELTAAKARGMKVGNPNGGRALRGKQIGNDEAVAAVKAKAEERSENLRAIIDDMKAKGITSVRVLTAELNARGILTARRSAWHPTTLRRSHRTTPTRISQRSLKLCGCLGSRGGSTVKYAVAMKARTAGTGGLLDRAEPSCSWVDSPPFHSLRSRWNDVCVKLLRQSGVA